jgi:NTP pyrophosphatase (non-canonical NTP hydrolase)
MRTSKKKSSSNTQEKKTTIFTKLSPIKPTEVFDTYWRFAAERQEIFFRRVNGNFFNLTKDPILSIFKFTNAYRASDRTSQYLIKNVIYQGNQSPEEVFFRIIIFKLFNKIGTWELLTQNFGEVTYSDYSFKKYDSLLSQTMAKGQRIYSAAYITSSGRNKFGFSSKHSNHLKVLEMMMNDEVPKLIMELQSMQRVFELLRSYPTFGDFLAYQFATDINYSELTNFQESQFVIPGPGAKDGIKKCFHDLGGLNEIEIIKFMSDRQEDEFERLNLNFKPLWGRPLQLIDCQNLFCEVDKYARLAHPKIKGISGRTRIKQKFLPNPEPIEYWYPPKWGINDQIKLSNKVEEKPLKETLKNRDKLNLTKNLIYEPIIDFPMDIFKDSGVRINVYQDVAKRTDKMDSKSFEMPVLGLFGEVGGLLSALKKKQRDKENFVNYDSTILEELGDVLWYFTSIATRANLELDILAQKMGRGIEDWENADNFKNLTFLDIEKLAPSLPIKEFSNRLTELAGKVGDLANDYSAGKFKANRDNLSGHLVEIFRALLAAANAGRISINRAAHENLRKTYSRWPIEEKYPSLIDENIDEEDEKLPRRFKVFIKEKKAKDKYFVIQKCNDIIIGDRLTDNKTEKDDYRFHDVFHIAYAVHLGWSPVLRTLFRVKRKSDPDTDENQDGARAILIEEGVASFVFSHALKRDFFNNAKQVDYDLLKSIQEMIQGYEVQRCALWQWEKAILDGFKIFQSLKKHRSGYVTADLEAHTLKFELNKNLK